MQDEIWRPVVGYEDCYEVSNIGRLRTVGHIIEYSDGRSRHVRGGRIISYGKPKPNGYYIKCLQRGNTKKYVTIHRLVATAFIPNPENLEQVNHKNGVKTDNRASNLEWVSRSENSIHSSYTLNNEGGWKKRGVRCIDDGTIYQSVSEAARAHDVCVNNFPHVCGNPNRTLAGKYWEYI